MKRKTVKEFSRMKEESVTPDYQANTNECDLTMSQANG